MHASMDASKQACKLHLGAQGNARGEGETHQIMHNQVLAPSVVMRWGILAEGAIALSVTLSGGALFAS